MVEKPTPYIYDMSKSYIEGKYALGIISSIMPENCVYIVIQGNLSERYGYYYLSYNKKQEYKNLKLNSKGTSLYSKKEETKETDEVGTKTNLIPIIKGETYTFEAGGNGAIEFYNSSGIKITKSLPHLNPVEGARYKWTITIPLETDITHVTFLGYNSKKATLTGFFIEEKNTNFELKLIEENFDLDIIISLRKLLNIGAGTGGTFYNVLDYGVSELSEDNSAALQIAIDEVNAQGGGILWIPKGTYNFKSSRVQVNNGNMEAAVWAKSKVSIIGESLSGTVLKMIGDSANGHGFTLFGFYNNTTPLEGCSYMNFTIDGADATITEYNHHGKAFYYHNIKDCVFRDLRLLNTPATALGIDMLVNTVMDSIYCENCGREWVYDTGNGGAGIGIGTGKFANENYVIRNCICVGCGHFGIFLEDQGIFSPAKDKNYPKGAIVTNNICRNGRYGGIGLRGGRYVLIQNNICYENNDAGIEVDYGTKECDIMNNICYANKESGIAIENIVSGDKENLNFSGNRLSGNKIGMKINSPTSGLSIIGNIVKSNTSSGLTFINNQVDTIIKNNIIIGDNNFQDDYFTGSTTNNDLLSQSF